MQFCKTTPCWKVLKLKVKTIFLGLNPSRWVWRFYEPKTLSWELRFENKARKHFQVNQCSKPSIDKMTYCKILQVLLYFMPRGSHIHSIKSNNYPCRPHMDSRKDPKYTKNEMSVWKDWNLTSSCHGNTETIYNGIQWKGRKFWNHRLEVMNDELLGLFRCNICWFLSHW